MVLWVGAKRLVRIMNRRSFLVGLIAAPVAAKLTPFMPAPAPEVVIGDWISPAACDGAALGMQSKRWSELYLAAGDCISFHDGDVTITYNAKRAMRIQIA